MNITRAISIKQPWVEQILRGIKTKEYRSVPTGIRERVYLYASLQPADAPAGWKRVKKSPGELVVGKIVGTVEVTGWNKRLRSYEYLLSKPKRLRSPLTARNQPQPRWWRPQF
jgi:hypothetical protein